MNPKAISNLVTNTQIGKKGYMFIIDSNGTVIADPDDSLQGSPMDKLGNFKSILNKANGTFSYKDMKTGSKMTGVFNTSDINGWKYVAAGSDEQTEKAKECVKNMSSFSNEISEF